MTALIRGELIKTVSTRTGFGYAVIGVALAVASVLIVTLSEIWSPRPTSGRRSPACRSCWCCSGSSAPPASIAIGRPPPPRSWPDRGAGSSCWHDRVPTPSCGLALGGLMVVVTLALGLPLLASEPGPGLGAGDVAIVAGGSVFAAALSAIMGVAVGALVRNQVAGVVGALIVGFVVTPLLSTIDATVVEFTPFGSAMVLAGDPNADTLSRAGRRWCSLRGQCPCSSGRSPPNGAATWRDRPGRPSLDERRPHGRRSWVFDARLALFGVGAELSQVIPADGTASGRRSSWRWSPAACSSCGGRRRSRCSQSRAWPLLGLWPVGEEPTGVAGLIALYTTAAICERRVSLAALARGGAWSRWALRSDSGHRGSGDLRPRWRFVAPSWWLASGDSAPTHRPGVTTCAGSKNAPPRPNASASSWPVSRSMRSGRRSPVSCTTSSPTRSASCSLACAVRATCCTRHPQVADETLARVETSGEQSLAELRRILTLLREPDGGVESRPQPSLADLDGLVAGYRAAGLPVRLEVTGERQSLPGGVELSVFRIVQEALTNALKHSDPTRVTVTLSFHDSRLDLEIVDDGTTVPDRHYRARHHRDARAGRSARRRARHGQPGGWRLPCRGAPARRWRRMTIRLLIVDDQELIRTGFRLFLETQADLEVVGEAGDGLEAIERARELRPDVVLMDIRMPRMDGVEATARLTAAGIEPRPRVLVLTTFDLDEYVFGALRAGAAGFLLKDAPRDRLLEAIRVVHGGDSLLSPSITRRLIEKLRHPHRPARTTNGAARTAHPTRARGAPSGCTRTLQWRDRETIGGDRRDRQEPHRQHPHEARPPRPGTSRRLRLRARHRRRRRTRLSRVGRPRSRARVKPPVIIWRPCRMLESRRALNGACAGPRRGRDRVIATGSAARAPRSAETARRSVRATRGQRLGPPRLRGLHRRTLGPRPTSRTT